MPLSTLTEPLVRLEESPLCMTPAHDISECREQTMSRASAGALTLLASTALTACSDATGPDVITSDWEGFIETGDAIEIKGVNGRIEAFPTSDESVRVTTTKRGLADDPDLVRLEVLTHSEGVTICAVYPPPPGEPTNECAPGLAGRMNVQNNDVEVDFTVHVPEGVDFVARDVNGPVRAEGLLSDSYVYTVNGDATVTTSGLGEAMTVNGSVRGSLGLTSWNGELTFATVNGNVTVELPAGVNARVTSSTVSGTLSSEFGGTQSGPGSLVETLGTGGGSLILSTVNGNVRLERAG
jgi:hypothetical protein